MMKSWIPCLLLATLLAGQCRSASDHETNVELQTEQLCDARQLVAVGRFLHLAHFVEPAGGRDPDANAVIAAAACKAQPANRRISLVAVAYRAAAGVETALVIAALDVPSGQVMASYQGSITEDASMKIVQGSLWIDTTAYDLAPAARAFGLDVTSGDQPDCADGGSGATRTLYVAQGKFIRPVLHDLPVSEWFFIQRGQSGCTDSSAPEKSIVENFTASLALASGTTNGYRDLAVSGVSTRDDGVKSDRRPFRATLKFDGKAYPLGAMRKAWLDWRS